MKFKKKYLYAGIFIALIIIGGIAYFNNSKQNEKVNSPKNAITSWTVDEQGHLMYPSDRGNLEYAVLNHTEDGNLSINKIIFQSNNSVIYAYLVAPKAVITNIAGVVLLPGAGVTKESELALAKEIAMLDFAVLTIDTRGVGETNGAVPSLNEDFNKFVQGTEPFVHKNIYDALRAYDIMKSFPFVDGKNIIIAGESMGGRNAIIAAAIEPNIKGVIAISSAGFGFSETGDADKNRFIKSIDPDNYISMISPRAVVMLHNINDDKIPIQYAYNTYNKAKQPRMIVFVNDTQCIHGYCESMYNDLVQGLGILAQ